MAAIRLVEVTVIDGNTTRKRLSMLSRIKKGKKRSRGRYPKGFPSYKKISRYQIVATEPDEDEARGFFPSGKYIVFRPKDAIDIIIEQTWHMDLAPYRRLFFHPTMGIGPALHRVGMTDRNYSNLPKYPIEPDPYGPIQIPEHERQEWKEYKAGIPWPANLMYYKTRKQYPVQVRDPRTGRADTVMKISESFPYRDFVMGTWVKNFVFRDSQRVARGLFPNVRVLRDMADLFDIHIDTAKNKSKYWKKADVPDVASGIKDIVAIDETAYNRVRDDIKSVMLMASERKLTGPWNWSVIARDKVEPIFGPRTPEIMDRLKADLTPYLPRDMPESQENPVRW